MNILDTSSWTDTSEFLVKKGTVVFLQQAYQQIVGATLQALLNNGYSTATIYVLYGVQNSGSGSYYNISAGAIFYEGEVFLVDATSFTCTGSNVAVFHIVTTQYTTDADPSAFTDGASRNVHNIRKFSVSSDVPTSPALYSAAFFCNFQIPTQLNLTAAPPQGGVANAAEVLGTYPDQQIYVPGNNNIGAVVAIGNLFVGDVPTGGATYTVTFATPLPSGTTYLPFLQPVSQGGSPHDDDTVTLAVIQSSMTVNGFQFRAQEWDGVTQSLSVNWICHKTS